MSPDTGPKIEIEESIPLVSNAESVKRYRQAHPAESYARRQAYRHRNSKWQTDASYLKRPFLAWDGEGITREDGSHDYVMLAVKSRESSDYIGNVKGISTAAIFEFVLDNAHENEGAISIIYGGGYDFNMWMRDVPREHVEKIYKDKYHNWGGYRIGWRPGKSFYLCRIDERGKSIGKGVTIYDVVSFFQCAFVKACDDYLGDKFEDRDLIVSNKALRSTFVEEDIPTVRRYNDAELTNLLSLMEELRSRLNRAGLRPRRWDGPGAVASALLAREKVKDSESDCPSKVAQAARFAYAGGRFEVIRFGHVTGKVWEYDVNSAYPSALRNVPDLTAGRWRYLHGDPGRRDFGLYHVRYSGNNAALPGALFRRDSNGTISYPMSVTGWYWSPEVETAREYCAMGYGTMEVLEARWFEPSTDRKPFDFIDGLYLKRKALKKGGDGAHVGIKLALNSLYGKLAQQVGWERKEDGTLRIPPYHQLEWAGYTTSWCRAAVLSACLTDLASVIAFETDAVFSSAPLPVTTGEGLGDFEVTEFDDLTYVQSGLYFGRQTGKGIVSKTRGVDRGSLLREAVLDQLAQKSAEDRVVAATLTRFVGAGVALTQSWERWRRWETIEKHMVLEPTGKRIHGGCECQRLVYDDAGRPRQAGLVLEQWHTTRCPLLSDTHSAQFPIEWINPDPNMADLEEMRRTPDDYE